MSQHRRLLVGKRPPRRNVRAFLLTTVIAATCIFGGAEYLIQFQSPVKASSLASAIGAIPMSSQAAVLETQRQHMILMVAATRTFKVVGTSVAQVPAPAGGAPLVAYGPPPNPGTAQAIAYKMLSSFGFATSQFGCLNNIWSRESGWRYNAANPSGAYGIPQALPGDKMASAGADWQTNPATQIRWGLGYIKERYGTPCNAWAFWQVHSAY